MDPRVRRYRGLRNHRTEAHRCFEVVWIPFPEPGGKARFSRLQPIVPQHFHKYEVLGHSPDGTHRLESGLFKTALRPFVPVEGVEVNAVQLQVTEHVVQEGGHCVVTVGIAPVVPCRL